MLQYALVQLLLSMSAPAFAFLAVLLKVVMAYTTKFALEKSREEKPKRKARDLQ